MCVCVLFLVKTFFHLHVWSYFWNCANWCVKTESCVQYSTKLWHKIIWWKRCIKRKFLPVDFFPFSKKAFRFLIDHFWGVRETLMEQSFLFKHSHFLAVELLDANVGALHSISALTLSIRSFMYLCIYVFNFLFIYLFLYPFRFVLLVCACVCMCCYTSFFIHLTFKSSMAVYWSQYNWMYFILFYLNSNGIKTIHPLFPPRTHASIILSMYEFVKIKEAPKPSGKYTGQACRFAFLWIHTLSSGWENEAYADHSVGFGSCGCVCVKCF